MRTVRDSSKNGLDERSIKKLVVLGQGYVGLPLAMRAVEVGFDVVGFDIDERKIDALRGGNSFVGDVDSALLRTSLESGRYFPTTLSDDLSGSILQS